MLVKAFGEAHDALQIYARHFHAISADIAEYKRQFDAQQAQQRVGVGVRVPHRYAFGEAFHDLSRPTPDTSQPLTRPAHTTDYEELARQAKRKLTGYAHTAGDRLDKAVATIVSGKTKLTPAQIRRQVTATQHIHDNAGGVAGAFANISGAARAVPPGAVNGDGTIDWGRVHQLPTLPAAGATAAEVSSWWRALDVQQQIQLINDHTDTIGNLDGIPCASRDTANRISLTSYLAAMNDGTHQWHDGQPSYDTLEDLQTKLNSGVQPPYLLLGFQPDIGNGRVITSQGNPDTATNTSVFVPGTTTTFDGIASGMNTSTSMLRSAKRLGGVDPSKTAMITWYGYDAPQSVIPDAASNSYADKGAPLLDSFASGLRTTHGGRPSHTTVVSHSYGTTLVGKAASNGRTLDADDLIMVASPGAGSDTVGPTNHP